MEQKKLVSKTERVQYSPVIISAVKITYRMFLFLTTTKIRRANKMVLIFVEGSGSGVELQTRLREPW